MQLRRRIIVLMLAAFLILVGVSIRQMIAAPPGEYVQYDDRLLSQRELHAHAGSVICGFLPISDLERLWRWLSAQPTIWCFDSSDELNRWLTEIDSG